MPLLDHFGLVAPLYDRVIQFRTPDRLIEICGLPTDGLLLDAGGGTGRVAQALRGLAAGVVVADESEGMLRQARGKKGLRTVLARAERLPFPDGRFSRVIMVDALHHVVSQGRTAGEMWRVLALGGRIVIQEPDIRTLIVKFVALGEKLALMRSHFLAPAKIAGLFTGYPGAKARIERENYNSWIVIEKK